MPTPPRPDSTRAIKRTLACMLAAALLFAGVAVAAASGSPGSSPLQASGIAGQVFDATCYGPCVEGAPPRTWQGEGLTVTVRRLPDGELVARATPEDGRFRFDLPPGAYAVAARVEGRYWEPDRKRVRVDPGEVEHVRLVVRNNAIR
jgi:hypothetical protein